MRILGIVIIVVTLGFLGGYGVLREFNSTEDKPSIPQLNWNTRTCVINKNVIWVLR